MKRLPFLLLAFTLSLPLFAAETPLVIQGGQVKRLPAATALQLNAPTSGSATVNMPHGTAPSSPSNGDCWTTTAGLYCRISGTTVGPYGSTTGTVTSVQASGGTTGLSFSGGPITTSGTLTLSGPTLASGTYTPTLTGVTNIDALTANVCQYMRVGDVVTVSCIIGVDATATGNFTARISLPVTSNLGSSVQLAGTANAASAQGYARIVGDSTNDVAQVDGNSGSTSSINFSLTFTYRVI